MNESSCDCCQGTAQLTPATVVNRPGLDALAYRVGTHATFFETMKARLSSMAVDIRREDRDSDGKLFETIYPLAGLTTRIADDPAIALLDGWATVGDVLTFYQERIANEGYLRTATERRSVLELARLVGYALRPGVAATTFLAYTIEPTHQEPVEIAVGARTQSVPGPGELPQSFETSEKIEARAVWNTLKPRLTRLQTRQSIENDLSEQPGEKQSSTPPVHEPRLYLRGSATNLKAGDPLLVDLGDGPKLRWVQAVLPDAAHERTLVRLQPWQATAPITRPQEAPDLSELAEFSARQDYVSMVRLQIERYLDLEAFHVDPDGAMAGRVMARLKEFAANLRDDMPPEELTGLLHNHLLPPLRVEQIEAREGAFRWLEPWVSGLVTDLEASMIAATDLLASAAALSFAQPPIDFAVAAPLPTFDDASRKAIAGLTLSPSVPPPNALQFARKFETAFVTGGDIALQVAGVFSDALRTALPATLANVQQTAAQPLRVYALRTKAAPFGHNAPLRSLVKSTQPDNVIRYEEWLLNDPLNQAANSGDCNEDLTGLINGFDLTIPAPIPQPGLLYLDAEYNLSPGGWVVITTADQATPTVVQLTSDSVTQLSVAGYGLSGKSTRLKLGQETWLNNQDTFTVVRNTVVYAQSELLELAEEPYTADVTGALIELDDVYSGLQSGRWLIVTGERTDIQTADPNDPQQLISLPGVKGAELVMLSQAFQDVQRSSQTVGQISGPTAKVSNQYGYDYGEAPDDRLPGDKIHTFIRLARPLAYRYKRDTVTIYGNVVKASHGETRNEVLGSGDGSKALQTFTLRQPPLTYIAASIPAGAESTLKVYVNDVEWHESDALAGLAPTDRRFITRTNDEGKTSVIFGNGRAGARLPTGVENAKAVYRNGIGKPGNVQAQQISLLSTRPLGVKGVINPIRASGGADKESRDQARRNAPLAVMALDRLVSVQDYADFARTFAGIGKADARRMAQGRRQLVHVTIAGADDIPIELSSDLYRNLVSALRQFGDPDLPIQVDARELLLLVISANVRILPDYLWEPVVKEIRAKLLETFSFDHRLLGQDALLSEVISTIQQVEGVAYVDVDLLRGIPEKIDDGTPLGARRLLTPAEITAEIGKPPTIAEPLPRIVANLAEVEMGESSNTIRPAQLAFLAPGLPDTLILNQIT